MPKKKARPHPTSHLFTVRLWAEESGNDQIEIRTQVQHVLSGETRYFREWSKMVAYMETKLREANHQKEQQIFPETMLTLC